EIRRDGGEAMALPADLADPAARRRVVEAVEAWWGPVEILINNAGFGYYGLVTETPWEVIERMFTVNVLAMIDLTRLVIPRMQAVGHGH
ncbi:MAG: oxidoreductase, partial [Thermoflexus sp.]